MRSLCLLFGFLFLAAQALAEEPAEDTGLSLQGEEMEPGREMKEEEAGDIDQLILNEDAPEDFLLASSTPGQNRKGTYTLCSCRRNCPEKMRRGHCLRNFPAYICCFSRVSESNGQERAF